MRSEHSWGKGCKGRSPPVAQDCPLHEKSVSAMSTMSRWWSLPAATLLAQAGLEVPCAQDGHAALAALHETPGGYAAVVTTSTCRVCRAWHSPTPCVRWRLAFP